ncbi:hypothetical protein Cni_G03163 [Canna indica]|uniref:CCHC-type domain-containing protein n=1 Tax=Canna indica TaxID=4628 RepID=A0AAQ3JQS5_9LILI|nr:hypothetical protein Cni_G03163 [Canna indica]
MSRPNAGEWTTVSYKRGSRRVSFGSAPPPSSSSWVPSSSFADAVRSFRPPLDRAIMKPASSSSPRSSSSAPAPDIAALFVHLRKSGRCFNCCAHGHRSFDCRERPVCLICHRSGHKARNCFHPSAKRVVRREDSSSSALCVPSGASDPGLVRTDDRGKSVIQDALPAGSSMLNQDPPCSAAPVVFLPPSEATLDRSRYLAERCVVVSVKGYLEKEADIAGFLASCFRDAAKHQRLWRQRLLPGGRFFITTPAGFDSYYKRTLIERCHFCWLGASLRVVDWIEEEAFECVPPLELSVGIELHGLPLIFWNDVALSALVCNFGAFDTIDVRSLRWADMSVCHIRLRVRDMKLIPSFIFAVCERHRYKIEVKVSWSHWIFRNRPPPPSSSSGGSSLGDDFDKVVDGPPSLVTPNGSSDASEIPITASTSSSATLCRRLVTRVGDEVQSPVMTSEELPLSMAGGGDSVGGVDPDPGEMEFLLVNDGSLAQMVSVQVSSASFLSELPVELSSSVPSASFPFSDLTHWSEDAAAAWRLVQEKLLPLLMNQLLASERVALKFYLFMACALLGKEIVVFCRRVWRLVDPAVSNGSSFLSSLPAAISSPEPLVFSDRVSLRCLNLEPLDMSDVTICLPGPIVDPSPALDSDLLSSASPSDRRRYAITYSRRRGRAPPLFLVRRSRRLLYSGASSDSCLKRALARKASKNGDLVPPPPARSMMDSSDGRPLLGSHFSSAMSSLSSLSLDDQVRNLGFSISDPATLVAKALHDLNVDANSSA